MDISKTKLGDLGTMSGIGPKGPAAAELPAGKLVSDRYEIVRVIGSGGMGVVYEANDRLRGSAVALKFLRPELVSSDTATQRFLNEARIASDLAHDSIVRVYDVSRHEDSYFLTMELLQGKSLRQLLQEMQTAGEQMPVAQALGIAKDVAQALAYAHRTTIHRDIKPENIWILPDGRAKVMDFGIARLQSQTQGLTKTATALGTAYYMAPEQLVGSGQIDHRADQYSLGVVLYEMLTGTLPIGRSSAASTKRKALHKKVDSVLDQMLAGSPDDRFGDDATVHQALAALSTERRGFIARIGKPLTVSLASVLIVFLAYGGFHWFEDRQRVQAESEGTRLAADQAVKQREVEATAARNADQARVVAEQQRAEQERQVREKAEAERAAAQSRESRLAEEAKRKGAPVKQARAGGFVLSIAGVSCTRQGRDSPAYEVQAHGSIEGPVGGEVDVATSLTSNGQVKTHTTKRLSSSVDCGTWGGRNDKIEIFASGRCYRRPGDPEKTTWRLSQSFEFKDANDFVQDSGAIGANGQHSNNLNAYVDGRNAGHKFRYFRCR